MTIVNDENATTAARITGVDVARGIALLGMMAVHSFDVVDEQGEPTWATAVAAGRSAATFVLIAGVSLAFMSGRRRVVRGAQRTAVSAGLVVRALLIGAIGLALGMLGDLHGVDGILAFYAVLFLLAIPLLGLAPAVLAGVAAAVVVAGPVLVVATAGTPLAERAPDIDPSFATVLEDPLGVLIQVFVTGEYPVATYLAYICVGLAIGRLDLGSRRVAWWLLGGGVVLAVVARLASALVLYRFGGFESLGADRELLWQSQTPISSWWSLALPAPHSRTTVDLVHTLGSAIAVLGGALLLTRVPAVARLLSPLAAAGTMVLTLYSAHLLFLSTGLFGDSSVALYLAMVVGGVAFAVVWRRWVGQGPLERVVAAAAGAARRQTAALLVSRAAPATGSGQGHAATPRYRRPIVARAVQLSAPPALAGALVLVYWASTPIGMESASASAGREEPALSAPVMPGSIAPSETAEQVAGAPDIGRYCQLSDQLGDLEDRYSDDPKALLRAAGTQLVDMPRVAPVEIRGAVVLAVDHIRADAGDPAANPDESAITGAETTIDTFEDKHC